MSCSFNTRINLPMCSAPAIERSALLHLRLKQFPRLRFSDHLRLDVHYWIITWWFHPQSVSWIPCHFLLDLPQSNNPNFEIFGKEFLEVSWTMMPLLTAHRLLLQLRPSAGESSLLRRSPHGLECSCDNSSVDIVNSPSWKILLSRVFLRTLVICFRCS